LARLLGSTLIAIGVLGGLYWWGFIDGDTRDKGSAPIDIGKMRTLAGSMPGSRPQRIRAEHVATFNFFTGMIVAGDGWSKAQMAIYAYQLEYPDGTLMIDAAFDKSSAPPGLITAMYDEAAYERVKLALLKASQIVITHEHMDHIGGVLQHPDAAKLIPALRLTDAQMAHPERMRPATMPAALREVQPLRHEGMTAIAPGVVTIAAAGHTPGSQMVFVKLEDGRELLFLGDVTWHARNIHAQRERPRWVTAMLIQEDREAVSRQINALHALAAQEPALRIIPGHDGALVRALIAKGELQPGFASP
jgi:glyoxylase-like metal-dependent hydrolase (beta-lactamase superfamily II)